jgi:esterase/lipase superfamily enzyme
VPVFYATDRTEDSSGWYGGGGNDADKLAYGLVKVSIPDRRRKGDLPKRRFWHVGFNPQRRVEILSVDSMDEGEFLAGVRRIVPGTGDDAPATAGAEERDVLVFVHGYNVTFVDAARRAAQLAYDLDFPGVPMLYSWPSTGTAAGYVADRENALWSVDHFVDFLRVILTDLRPRKVHALAHSMGNQVLIEGLDRLAPDDGDRWGNLVLVAADFDTKLFRRRAAAFGRRAARYTVYVSSRDLALKLSELLSGHPRVGQGGRPSVVVAEVDTIDASTLRGDLLNHSTFAANPLLLNDIIDLIRHGRPPGERAGIQVRDHPGGIRYWAFPA